MVSIEGVDYSWGRPDLKCLHSKGKQFACRYLSFNTDNKTLTRGEADQITAAGMWVVANWEQTGKGDIGGRTMAQAVDRALQIADQCNIPKGRPIYLSVDYDVQPGEYNRIEDIIGKAQQGIGKAYDVGALYGSYSLLRAMFDRGAIRWGWQTYAWSYGNVDPRAQVLQYHNGVSLCGGDIDLDRAFVADYGQWRPGVLPKAAGGSAIPDTDSDTGSDQGEDAMPLDVTLTYTKPFDLKAGQAVGLVFDHEASDAGDVFMGKNKPGKGQAHRAIDIGGRPFVSTLNFVVDGKIAAADSVLTALMYVNTPDGKDDHQTPWQEHTGSSYQTYVQDTRVGTCPGKDSVKVWVKATKDCQLTNVTWRVKYW